MTENKYLFKYVSDYDGGVILFRGYLKGMFIGIGTISFNESGYINNIYLVKSLKDNLLSISQLCNSNLEICLKETGCIIEDANGSSLLHVS